MSHFVFHKPGSALASSPSSSQVLPHPSPNARQSQKCVSASQQLPHSPLHTAACPLAGTPKAPGESDRILPDHTRETSIQTRYQRPAGDSFLPPQLPCTSKGLTENPCRRLPSVPNHSLSSSFPAHRNASTLSAFFSGKRRFRMCNFLWLNFTLALCERERVAIWVARGKRNL